jgi:hypothetical protein
VNQPPPPGRWTAVFMALAFFGAGAAILGLAAGVVGTLPAAPEAPRWVIGCAGLMFLAGGFVPLGLVLGFPAWLNQFVGLIVTAALATVFNWIAFLPGERHFVGGGSLWGLHLWSGSSSQIGGRIAFGIAAILLDALLIGSLWRFARLRKPA